MTREEFRKAIAPLQAEISALSSDISAMNGRMPAMNERMSAMQSEFMLMKIILLASLLPSVVAFGFLICRVFSIIAL